MLKADGAYAGENPFRFSTKYQDNETGLYYYGYRYYLAEMGRWLNRDPLGERGGLNLYGFVGNNPINYFDVYGLWKAWTHRHLTEKAWKKVKKPDGMDQYDKKILKFLKKANVSTDKGESFKDHSWHFGRGSGDDTEEWIINYMTKFITKWEEIEKLISNPNKQNCLDALHTVGMLSHAYQDYYAHAVNINSDGDDDTIGEITGTPELPGVNVKPSSYDKWYRPGEHGWIEPGKQAPDADEREKLAIDWTVKKLNEFLNIWWEPCECYAKEMFK